MKDMELLTEKDLEYFRKKAEEGQVVILELSKEQLLNLDFSRWMNREVNTIEEVEVMEWLQKRRSMIKRLYDVVQNTTEDIRQNTDGRCKSLIEWMQNHKLSNEGYETVRQAIREGFTEEQLLTLLSFGNGSFLV
ncbi:MAG: hypothetical protein SOY73_03965 [Blautia sp.]|nr:hypothetical protein [Blautia sp.]